MRAAPGATSGPGRLASLRGALTARAPRALPPGPNTFRCEGDYWLVAFEGRTVRVRDLKGMHYLARLLAEPGREFHALDLVALESGGDVPFSVLGDAGEMLDPRAKEAYRRRLAEIEEDLEEARAMGDAARATQAEVERDFLVRELSRAVGLGGRDRRAGSASERARASVTRAIRQAMTRIREHDRAPGKAPGPCHPHRRVLRVHAGPAGALEMDVLRSSEVTRRAERPRPPQPRRPMPSFCIRYCSEVRFMPSLAAAPAGPAITHLHATSVLRMSWRSDSWGLISATTGSGVAACSSDSGTSSSGPRVRITLRSMRFSSSRTFPGQR